MYETRFLSCDRRGCNQTCEFQSPTLPKVCKRKGMYFYQLVYITINHLTENLKNSKEALNGKIKKLKEEKKSTQTGRHTQLSVHPKICFLCYYMNSFSPPNFQFSVKHQKFRPDFSILKYNLHKPSWLEIPLITQDVSNKKGTEDSSFQ